MYYRYFCHTFIGKRFPILAKKESCLQDSPPVAGRGNGMLPSAAVRLLLFTIWKIRRVFLYGKKIAAPENSPANYF
jgi:hypothetical protein